MKIISSKDSIPDRYKVISSKLYNFRMKKYILTNEYKTLFRGK